MVSNQKKNVKKPAILNHFSLIHLHHFLLATQIISSVSSYQKLAMQTFLLYRGSPTYEVFTAVDPTTIIFGLCTRKWGILALFGDPLQSNTVFF